MEQETVVQGYTSITTGIKAHKGGGEWHGIYSLNRLLALGHWSFLSVLGMKISH